MEDYKKLLEEAREQIAMERKAWRRIKDVMEGDKLVLLRRISDLERELASERTKRGHG